MAGGLTKYRHLSRKSSHRQALLRNLVDSLIEHESVQTTWHKAKEAQRLAEKVITLGKKNTEASRRRAMQIFYRPHELIPKLFGPLRTRYLERPGGYTRVLRIEPLSNDQSPSAILELVDGPKDMRFSMTARTLARQRMEDLPETDLTRKNIEKVTKFREGGLAALEEE
ncbi:ribosomal protein L17, partial [Tothia fuscella]